MTAAFLAGLVAGYGVAVPVGAIAVLILGLSARTSLRVGAAAAFGVATADGLYAAVAVLGGAAVAAVVAPVAGPLRVVAAVVLLALAVHGGWRAWRSRPPSNGPDLGSPGSNGPDLGRPGSGGPVPVRPEPGGPGSEGPGAGGPGPSGLEPGRPGSGGWGSGRGMDTPGRAFAGVLALTLLNPATVVYFAALVLGRADVARAAPAAAALFVLGAFVASASWQLLIAGSGTLVGRVLAGPRGRLLTGLLSSTIIAALAVAMLVVR
ncbi:lysine transporter LysE [Micromonospora sp. HM134]|uniref:LysE family transporter n=1 Tax=Micromonospora sp. HM134 TaxID=2583243 RepID=UPI0011984234|nr:LysE family transporter [Micromonospora sp. HM134]QDY09649.1 lysine transporter LysE [Micromonospora sp. HM134]